MKYYLSFILIFSINHLIFAQRNPTFEVPTETSIDDLAKELKIKYYKNPELKEEYWFDENGHRIKKIDNKKGIKKTINYKYDNKGNLLQGLAVDEMNDTIYFKYNTYKNDFLIQTLLIELTEVRKNPNSKIPFEKKFKMTKTEFSQNTRNKTEEFYEYKFISDEYIQLFVIKEYDAYENYRKTEYGIMLFPKYKGKKRTYKNKDGSLALKEEFGKTVIYNECGKEVERNENSTRDYKYRNSIRKYEYNENCKLLSMQYYKINENDVRGNLIEHEFYEYDKRGKLKQSDLFKRYPNGTIERKVKENFYDADSNLIETKYLYQDDSDSSVYFDYYVYNDENQLLLTSTTLRHYEHNFKYYFSTIEHTDTASIRYHYIIPNKMITATGRKYVLRDELKQIDTTDLELENINIYNSDSTVFRNFSYGEYPKEVLRKYDKQKRVILEREKKYYKNNQRSSTKQVAYEYFDDTKQKRRIHKTE